ncbi:MAG TPA: hypothetical protein VN926_24715 [Bradyrhizobium sp.]|jgi:hypothetical protein|nr:hypothetical protein [Bradyrhizobium sp.]
MKLPLPAIVELKDNGFIIVGKVTADDELVQDPSQAEELAQAYSRNERSSNQLDWRCFALETKSAPGFFCNRKLRFFLSAALIKPD